MTSMLDLVLNKKEKMTDTVRTRSYLRTALADNNAELITAKTMRDWLLSSYLAIDVDSSIDSLQSGINTINATLSAHETNTITHGTVGNIVGTSDAQTLTGKTISGSNNTFSNIPESAVTNLISDLAAVITTAETFAANASNISSGTINANRIPTLNQNTSGSAASLSSTLIVGQGGTGQTTLTAHGVLLGEGTSGVGIANVGTTGRILIDQGPSADPSFNTISGNGTLNNSGVLTITKVNGVAYGTTPSTNTVPVVTSSNTITYEAVPNAALANSSLTVTAGTGLTGGGTVSLGNSIILNVGTIAIANGGTGQTTANTALNALLPSQTGNNTKVLQTDGTNTSWTSGGGGGGSPVGGTGAVQFDNSGSFDGDVSNFYWDTGTHTLSALNVYSESSIWLNNGGLTLNGSSTLQLNAMSSGVAYINGTSVLTDDPINFYYDETYKLVGVQTAAPYAAVHAVSNTPIIAPIPSGDTVTAGPPLTVGSTAGAASESAGSGGYTESGSTYEYIIYNYFNDGVNPTWYSPAAATGSFTDANGPSITANGQIVVNSVPDDGDTVVLPNFVAPNDPTLTLTFAAVDPGGVNWVDTSSADPTTIMFAIGTTLGGISTSFSNGWNGTGIEVDWSTQGSVGNVDITTNNLTAITVSGFSGGADPPNFQASLSWTEAQVVAAGNYTGTLIGRNINAGGWQYYDAGAISPTGAFNGSGVFTDTGSLSWGVFPGDWVASPDFVANGTNYNYTVWSTKQILGVDNYASGDSPSFTDDNSGNPFTLELYNANPFQVKFQEILPDNSFFKVIDPSNTYNQFANSTPDSSTTTPRNTSVLPPAALFVRDNGDGQHSVVIQDTNSTSNPDIAFLDYTGNVIGYVSPGPDWFFFSSPINRFLFNNSIGVQGGITAGDFTAQSSLGFYDDADITFGTTTGTKIGTATNQKFAFYNHTPVVQPVLSYSRSAAGETAANAAIRIALSALGLVQDSTTA